MRRQGKKSGNRTTPRYVPERGDFVQVDFDPSLGHEQAKRRPALVLTPLSYNQKTSLFIVCPTTNQVKGYPFKVPIPPGLSTSGVVLVDQVKSLDWTTRTVNFRGKCPSAVLVQVLQKIRLLIF